ncbi:MAG: HTTM domain-containing protein [Myxococcota bacterium]
MTDSTRAFLRRVTEPQGLRALELFRMFAGCTILFQFASALPARHFLLGPNGVYPIELAQKTALFGLYGLAESRFTFDLIYFGSMGIVVIWIAGRALPWSTLAVFVVWRSMHDRLPGLADGGDNLIQLLLIYGALCDLGGVAARYGPTWFVRARGVLHNFGLLAIWTQTCVVYLVAGTAKLQGEAWLNGTALYYALSTAEYTTPLLVGPLLESPVLLVLLAYLTMLFQIGFPFLVAAGERSRRAALVIAGSFHLGIVVVMGLTSFGLFMIAADSTFLSDREISRLRNHLSRARSIAIQRLCFFNPRLLVQRGKTRLQP